jgi:hypothetical protein
MISLDWILEEIRAVLDRAAASLLDSAQIRVSVQLKAVIMDSIRLLTTILDIPGPALLSSLTQDNSAKGPVSTPTPPPFSQFASFSQPVSQSATPQPSLLQQSVHAPPPQPASDPFAALSAGLSSSQRASPAPPQAPAASNDDDEWSFSSALPPEPAKPKEHQATVSNTNLRIELRATRSPAAANAINIVFAFSNNIAQPISELHFQLAVTKVCITLIVPPEHQANPILGLRAST